jgi:hypothetical protein
MGKVKARLRYCEYCGKQFIGRSRFCKDSHRVQAWKRRKGLRSAGPVEARARALAHDPTLRPEYVEPPMEVHPVVLAMEREQARRPVDPMWDPWDPLSP